MGPELRWLLLLLMPLIACREPCAAYEANDPFLQLGLQGGLNDGEPHAVSFGPAVLVPDSSGNSVDWSATATTPGGNTWSFTVGQTASEPIVDLESLGSVQLVTHHDEGFVAVHGLDGGLLWFLAERSGLSAVDTALGWRLDPRDDGTCGWVPGGGTSQRRNVGVLVQGPDGFEETLWPSREPVELDGFGVAHVINAFESQAPPGLYVGSTDFWTMWLRADGVPVL